MAIKSLPFFNKQRTAADNNTYGKPKAPTSDNLSKKSASITKSNNKSKKNAPKEKEHSLLYGVYADVAKSLWKILSGAMITEILRGVLKTNKSFSLEKIIDKAFRVDFVSRFVGDFGGALTVRLFNGKTKLFGVLFPKIHTAISSQFFTNPWVKFWRTLTSSENLNRLTVEDSKDSVKLEASKNLRELGWMKTLNKIDRFYKKSVEPKLGWVMAKVFGIKPGEKTEDGKTSDPTINWMQFGGVAAAAAVATYSLPGDTQIFGFEDVNKSKGTFKTIVNSVITWGLTSLVRLENYVFNNAVTIPGMGMEKGIEISLREKGFIPMAQYACDNIAAIMSKTTSMNGAFLSSLIRLPVEIVTSFMTASLIGISDEDRVPQNWVLLANRIMKPVADTLDKGLKPIFRNLVKYVYRPLFGFYPEKLEALINERTASGEMKDKTVKLSDEILDSIKKKEGHDNTLLILLKSCFWDLWTKDIFNSIKAAKNIGKENKAKEKITKPKAIEAAKPNETKQAKAEPVKKTTEAKASKPAEKPSETKLEEKTVKADAKSKKPQAQKQESKFPKPAREKYEESKAKSAANRDAKPADKDAIKLDYLVQENSTKPALQNAA